MQGDFPQLSVTKWAPAYSIMVQENGAPMEEVRGLFSEFGEDPVGQAVEHARWWLVNRIRTGADARDVLRVARACLEPVIRAPSPVRGVAIRQSLALISDAIDAWDNAEPSEAERRNVWETLEASLVAAISRIQSPRPRHSAEIGLLFVRALREAYAIQKVGNRVSLSWGGDMPPRRSDSDPETSRPESGSC
jgi:hypothetical protein